MKNLSQQVKKVETEDGESLFCVQDVLDYLRIENLTEYIQDDEDLVYIYLSPRDSDPTLFVKEGKVYEIFFRLETKEAKEFQEWVLEKVLPSIGIESILDMVLPGIELISANR